MYWNGTSSRSVIKNVLSTCTSTSLIHNVPCTSVNKDCYQGMAKNTYLDQINNNRITVNGMIYTFSPVDFENLNPGTNQ